MSSLLLRLRLCSCDIGRRATASRQGNGRWPSLLLAAELGFRSGVLPPRVARGKGRNFSPLPQLTGLASSRAQDCQSVRIYAYEQRPRQDSNLRSGSGGRQLDSADLWRWPGWIYPLPPETANVIPGMFRIMSWRGASARLSGPPGGSAKGEREGRSLPQAAHPVAGHKKSKPIRPARHRSPRCRPPAPTRSRGMTLNRRVSAPQPQFVLLWPPIPRRAGLSERPRPQRRARQPVPLLGFPGQALDQAPGSDRAIHATGHRPRMPDPDHRRSLPASSTIRRVLRASTSSVLALVRCGRLHVDPATAPALARWAGAKPR